MICLLALGLLGNIVLLRIIILLGKLNKMCDHMGALMESWMALRTFVHILSNIVQIPFLFIVFSLFKIRLKDLGLLEIRL